MKLNFNFSSRLVTRRFFLKFLAAFTMLAGIFYWKRININIKNQIINPVDHLSESLKSPLLGVGPDGFSKVYMVKNESPEENIKKIIDMMGGINKYIINNDIVILKVNSQRYNQGTTNTDTLKNFIDIVLSIKNFSGEIIVADNHQYKNDSCCGWTTNKRNGQFNLDELISYYQEKGVKNVTKYHWHVAGPCSYPLEGDAQGNSRVTGPIDGDGYVWMEDEFYLSPSGRKCLMTYPIFTSNYSGITIDLRNGAWKNGKYLEDIKVRLVNFSCLNHHGRYCGVSASVKNLMGVVDMTCGFPGDRFSETYNTHHIGVSRIKKWLYHTHWRIRDYRGWARYLFEDFCYRNFHHTGGALGHFMANVRLPDINIIAAELVGWGGRRDLGRAFRPHAILAGTDPVALDYIAAKEILLPGTPEGAREESGVLLRELNDPDNKSGPFYLFLRETEKQGVGTLDARRIKVIIQ